MTTATKVGPQSPFAELNQRLSEQNGLVEELLANLCASWKKTRTKK